MLHTFGRRIVAGGAALSALLAYVQFYDLVNPILRTVGKYIIDPPNYIVSILAIVLGVLIIIWLLEKKKKIESQTDKISYAALSITIYLAVVFLLPETQHNTKLYLVHQDSSSKIRIPASVKIDDIEIEERGIDQLRKLAELGEINANSVLLSSVPRPRKAYGEIFDIERSMPVIISMQQVLEPAPDKLIDISSSSYSDEIGWYVKNKASRTGKIAILFERDYAFAEKILSAEILSSGTGVDLVQVVFDPDHPSNNLLSNAGASIFDYVIYLGSDNGFRILQAMGNMGGSLKHLIVPNWIRPIIQQNSPKSKTAVSGLARLCLVSEGFESFVNGDHTAWFGLLSIIKSVRITDVGWPSDKLRTQLIAWKNSTFPMNNNPKMVYF